MSGEIVMQVERRLDAGLLVGGGFLLVLVLTGQMYVWINLWPLRISWVTALIWSLPQIALWSLTIPIVDRFAARFPIAGARAPWHLGLHVIGSVGVAMSVLACLDLSNRWLGWTQLLGAPATLITAIGKTILHLHIGIATYWVVLAANHARRYYQHSLDREVQASRLEASLAEAQLSALRMQLDPHFLFNTLNSIGVLMHRDVRGAAEMLGRLSEFLRGTLQHSGKNEVALETELEYVRAYLDIERVRFGGRLSVRVSADADVECCAVPYLILQPLVENAVRHGLARRAAPGTIVVEARGDGEWLRLSVRDDGSGLAPGGATGGFGLGLTNVVRRLEHAFGSAHMFDLHDVLGGGVEAIVRIPRRECAESLR
jgi:two-component system, LytTR family, sensor kinase